MGSGIPPRLQCEGALEMFSHNPQTNSYEQAINIGQNQEKRLPGGFPFISPKMDFSMQRLFVEVNGNCCWKLFSK